MANTGRISGKDLFITFGGTEVHGDFTSVSVADADDQIDVTAGADTYHYWLSLARRDGTSDFEMFYDGATETVWDAIAPGTAGTLIMAPKGTASGNPKWTWTRALVKNRNVAMPFNDGVKVTGVWQFSSLIGETTY